MEFWTAACSICIYRIGMFLQIDRRCRMEEPEVYGHVPIVIIGIVIIIRTCKTIGFCRLTVICKRKETWRVELVGIIGYSDVGVVVRIVIICCVLVGCRGVPCCSAHIYLYFIVSLRQCVKEVLPICTCGLRLYTCYRVPVAIKQCDNGTGDPRFTGILCTVVIRITPYDRSDTHCRYTVVWRIIICDGRTCDVAVCCDSCSILILSQLRNSTLFGTRHTCTDCQCGSRAADTSLFVIIQHNIDQCFCTAVCR